MDVTTLLYLRGPEGYLMLHRTKKEADINQGKWIGVGGHVEAGESPTECVIREAYEETGLIIGEPKIRALVTFVTLDDTGAVEETDQMIVFTADSFEGELTTACPEGDLAWVPELVLSNLPMWEGDALFLGPILAGAPFFALKLVYQGGALLRWSVE